jgi:hypothetical protein
MAPAVFCLLPRNRRKKSRCQSDAAWDPDDPLGGRVTSSTDAEDWAADHVADLQERMSEVSHGPVDFR